MADFLAWVALIAAVIAIWMLAGRFTARNTRTDDRVDVTPPY
jgi:hypothetical protein